jgi:hypothetical protein
MNEMQNKIHKMYLYAGDEENLFDLSLMVMGFIPGDRVRFMERQTQDQISYCFSADCPNKILHLGSVYTVDEIWIDRNGSAFSIEGIEGKFNPITFAKVGFEEDYASCFCLDHPFTFPSGEKK